ncbi:MAG: DNA/RNA non-specific endonuclease [Clostridiales bacterium]|nr:DNA/RNA non-specific endonuclease [Clostridiales bacterium]
MGLSIRAEGNQNAASFDLSEIPDYSGSPYVEINDNVPGFTEEELQTESFESYSDLDEAGRCGAAYACIGTDLMPTEARGSIEEVHPTGWINHAYDIIDGEYLYNRCHLIGYQLTGENANEKNLITGTRYLNTEGMLPFENMVADYVKETENHVLYRVTPVFEGNNLVASGVLMEAMSVEDNGDGILFCVYCYNVQPGITIDYATGENRAEDDEDEGNASEEYVLNTNTKKFHYPDCYSVEQMSEKNKQEYTGNREDLIAQGYSPCKNCNP